MNEAYYTLLGMLFASLPSVISSILTYISQKKRIKHEEHLRILDLIDVENLKALREYAGIVGVLSSNYADPMGDKYIDRLQALHNQVYLFASEETRKLMSSALPVLLSKWDPNYLPSHTSKEKMESDVVRDLLEALHSEMDSACEQLINVRKRRIYKRRKP